MTSEPVFEALLTEASGNDAPDVSLSVLREAESEGLIGGEVPEPAPVTASDLNDDGRRLVSIVGWAAAACAIFAIGWILWPSEPAPAPDMMNPPELPVSVALSDDAEYEYPGEYVRLSRGYAVMREGAPEVRVGGSRVSNVSGTVLVRPGAVPDERELTEIQSRVSRGDSLKPEETGMLKNRKWIARGGVAVCVLVGSVALNGDVIKAQAVKRDDAKVAKEEPKSVADRAADLQQKFDKNDDGVVNKDDENWDNIKGYDTDENGEVSTEELEDLCRKIDERKKRFVEALKEREEKLKKEADEAGQKKADDFFGRLDKDEDNEVSADEAKGLGAETDAWVKKLDANEDGVVSKDEAEEFFKAESLEEKKKEAAEKGAIGMGGGIRIRRSKEDAEDAEEGVKSGGAIRKSKEEPEDDSGTKKDE